MSAATYNAISSPANADDPRCSSNVSLSGPTAVSLDTAAAMAIAFPTGAILMASGRVPNTQRVFSLGEPKFKGGKVREWRKRYFT